MEEGEGENDGFLAVFSHEINRISEYKMGTTMKIWTEALGIQDSSRDNTFNSKICSLKTPKMF